MYDQNQMCESPLHSENSGSPARRVVYAKPPSAWRSTLRFLSQAAVGGMIGSYALLIGVVLYYTNPYNFLLIFFLPLYLTMGAVTGLAIGSITTLLEYVIEEKLTMLPRAIATSAIAILLLAGITWFRNRMDWQLFRQCILIGAIIGFPIGLVTRSKLRLWRLLAHGTNECTAAEADANLPVSPLSSFLSLIGGLALRLVGVVGLL